MGTLIGVWTVGLSLGLYFANDIGLAEIDESTYYSDYVPVLGEKLSIIAKQIKLNDLQSKSTETIHQFYDKRETVGDNFPPAKWQDNAALGVSQRNEGFFPEECAEELPEPSVPEKVLIVGSSSMYGTMGVTLEKHLSEDANLEVVRHAKSGTGLARPDVYNWLDVSTELASEHRADLVIAQFIGNDCQALITPDKIIEARRRDDNWNEAYRGRVTDFVAAHQARGAEVVLIGMPIVRSRHFKRRLENANAIVKSVANEMDALYISVWEETADRDGNYTEELRLRNKTIKFRSDDGIHLSYRGAKMIAKYLFEELNKRYPWGEEQTNENTLATVSETHDLPLLHYSIVDAQPQEMQISYISDDTGLNHLSVDGK